MGAALSSPSTAWAQQTVLQCGQEPFPADRRFLVSLHRVPASYQVVFVHAPLGQAVFGRHFQPQLAARHSPASGDGRDPPAQFDPGAWQVTVPHISWAQEAKKIRLLPRDHHRAGTVRWEHAHLVLELGWRLFQVLVATIQLSCPGVHLNNPVSFDVLPVNLGFFGFWFWFWRLPSVFLTC